MRISEDVELLELTELKWHAIIQNDATSDGTFFYAVKTTGIFCRPSCKSKPPNRENIAIFPNALAAERANFRACKRCKPTGQRLPDEEWIKRITDYIDNHFVDTITLGKLADIAHGSPFHLHRTFKRISGVTPSAYINQLRIAAAKTKLIETDLTISLIGESVGMANTPYFITMFKKMTGYTPAQYRLNHFKEVK
ncbi:methylphosphotriester-DNA--protein-cysteine methyltransferase family protein [Paenibacillus sp. GSMTC-2017]|uniref:bifunctional transcriptional activator/DNA repair enzyme AdaA n=1 Tax=Paenibacillus sp. GSMTC-2017 TaxID=2794350 RepID=UPI0018D8CEAF|nr:bifunctional transcriptional activator/DNA repair enzyme AdaA [Paenibacillus sp. GSMTC-2017]MBH5320221.1 methylphosphotriester-DNA--protein-cysteine methyltransferase family protein [Paenibacillus sp. GSMTC-2017]